MKTVVWDINYKPSSNDGVFGNLFIDGEKKKFFFGVWGIKEKKKEENMWGDKKNNL